MKASRLQRELKQNRPFPSRAAEATVAIMKTADVVKRSVGGVIEKEGITMQQYNVLRILRGAGESGIPTLDIIDRMIEETPGITRLLDRIETKGLVRRERCKEDRRQVLCWITEPGLDVLVRLERPVIELERDAIGKLRKSELETLIALLDKVRAQLS